jgi:hypothetical protein
MNNSSHIHRLSLSWWFGYISIGGFILLIVIGTIIFNASTIFSNASILDYSGIFLLIAVMLPISLVLLVRPFLIKIIVKPQGIEYHSTFFILQADWKDLVNIGYVKKKYWQNFSRNSPRRQSNTQKMGKAISKFAQRISKRVTRCSNSGFSISFTSWAFI